MLQLKYGHDAPALRLSGTLPALVALRDAGHLDPQDAEYLLHSYLFLRKLQARLRLMSTTARNNLPEDPRELAKLASLLGYDSPAALMADCQQVAHRNRELFDKLIGTLMRSEATC